jgi:hypothetical protein
MICSLSKMSEVKVGSAQTNDEKQQHWIRVRDECQNDDGEQPCGFEENQY